MANITGFEDISCTDDLTVGDDATITGDLTVSGVTTLGKVIHEREDLTIASGVITVSKSYVLVAPETSTTDDLVTINGGTDGMILSIRPGGSNVITLKHGTGNLYLASSTDKVLNGSTELINLEYQGAAWIQVNRA